MNSIGKSRDLILSELNSCAGIMCCIIVLYIHVEIKLRCCRELIDIDLLNSWLIGPDNFSWDFN